MIYKIIYISWRSVRNFSMIYGKVSVSWRPRKKISMVMHKSSYIMEACKEFFHDIQRNLYTMEFREVTFHDIRINFHIMEYLKKPFHDIRRNFNIMEAHIKSTSPQSRRSGRQSIIQYNNTFFVKKEGQFLNSLKVYAKLYEGHGFWYVGALFCYFYGIKNGVYYGKCA